jgi:signal transduction histidine kinase
LSSGAWTAIGAIALAIATLATLAVTVVITRQDRRRADTRLNEEVKRNKDQLDKERRLAREREQFAEASLVEVVLAVSQRSMGL